MEDTVVHLSDERFLCMECRHRGPAMEVRSTEAHPYGERYALEELVVDLLCEKCGSPNIMGEGEDNARVQ